MKRLRWTRHALDGLAEREISRDDGERAIREPMAVRAGHGNRTLHLRKFYDPVLGQEMLLCVVTEERDEEIVVVTIYKTSRFGKYLEGEDS